MDVGPCFGAYKHPRRDTDVILRLSKSTIEDLSFYIGFTKELMAEMMVYDKTRLLHELFLNNRFSFFFLSWGSFLDFLDIDILIEKHIVYGLCFF